MKTKKKFVLLDGAKSEFNDIVNFDCFKPTNNDYELKIFLKLTVMLNTA